MSKTLIKGEKFELSKLEDTSNYLCFDFVLSSFSQDFDIDPFVFIIDENDVLYKNNIIFYNNPKDSLDIIRFTENLTAEKFTKSFQINLSDIPQNIKKLAFGVSIYRDNLKPKSSNVNLTFKAYKKISNTELFKIEEIIDFNAYESLLLGDIYKWNQYYKFNTLKYLDKIDIVDAIKSIYKIKIL